MDDVCTTLDYENGDASLSADSEDTRAVEVMCLLFTEQCNDQGNVIVTDADILQQLVGEQALLKKLEENN